MSFARACFAASSLLFTHGEGAAVRGAVKVTPVEKVIELLKQLQQQLEGEAKSDAAEYDKYACFCKDQVDEKQYAIEMSTKKIEELTAKITELDSEVNELNSNVADLSLSITNLDGEIARGESARASEHADYLVKEKDTSDAIKALEGAIQAMRDSKGAMTGAKLDLAQRASRAVSVAAQSMAVVLAQKQADMVDALAQLSKQKPTSYEYHSNEIVQTLDDLRKVFIGRKNDLDTVEFEARSAWEKRDMDLKSSVNFASKDKAEKEKISAYKQELSGKTSAEKTEEQADMGADSNFLDELKGECEAKATLFDQRSSTRTGELTAIAEAMSQLENGVASSYGANKKLVGIQIHAQGTSHKSVSRLVPSFLQHASANAGAARKVEKTKKVVEYLTNAGRNLHSNVLALTALRIRASEDHFVKVRGLIKDLIARLEADAQSEGTQKTFCDQAMAAAITSRDGANAQIETFAAEKAKLNAEKNTLTTEIAELTNAIAMMEKMLIDATDLRNQEKSDNEQTLATAQTGKTAVDSAVQTLSDFYNNAFVQYVPPNADRDGKTVSDRAPKVFDETYHGDQTKSKGIIGLLEVISSDFERTITTVTTQEGVAQAAFDNFKTTTEADINTKTTSKQQKETRVVTIGDLLVTNEDNTKEQDELLETALATLDELHSQCVAGEETYEDRVAKREKEIASLKEALSILDNWQN